MKGQSEKFTKILPLITNILKDINKKEQLGTYVSKQFITLAVIEKSPVLCLSDLTHSVQAIKQKIKSEDNDSVHPNSRKSNNYYCVVDRSWIALNSKVQDIKQPSEYPHPYEPYFYFKKNYEEYRKEKVSMSYKVECEVFLIKSWRVKIVNISTTGYYGIVLELVDFRPTGERFVTDVCNVTSILYEKSLQRKLEDLRLQDLRSLNPLAEDKKVPWSLFYYCRNSNMNSNPKKRFNNIITVDKQQKLLKFDEEKQSFLINFGQMEGVNCLQYPIDRKQIDEDKIRKINIKDLQLFFNVEEKMKEKDFQKKDYKPGELWSSDQEESIQEQEVKAPNEEQKQKDSESSSSDSQEDLLKSIYLKQFKNLKIV